MPTIEQAQAYNFARKNELWEELTPTQALVLLQDAEDYIRGAYDLRVSLTLEEGRILDNAICRLAATFQSTPPQVANNAALKRESKEGAGFKKETEYFAATGDPYPYITALMRALVKAPSSTGGIRISRMAR
jgi:hypothetical protein